MATLTSTITQDNNIVSEIDIQADLTSTINQDNSIVSEITLEQNI